MWVSCEQNKFPYLTPPSGSLHLSLPLHIKALTVHCASSVRRCQRSQHVPILCPLTSPHLVCTLLNAPICTELRS